MLRRIISPPVTVDDEGVVRNLRGKVIAGSPVSKDRPYLRCCIRTGGKATYHLLHRPVAEAHHANPENKPEVNHKDGDRTNNHPLNLEWATYLEQMKHAWATGLQTCSDHSRACSAERMRLVGLSKAGPRSQGKCKD